MQKGVFRGLIMTLFFLLVRCLLGLSKLDVNPCAHLPFVSAPECLQNTNIPPFPPPPPARARGPRPLGTLVQRPLTGACLPLAGAVILIVLLNHLRCLSPGRVPPVFTHQVHFCSPVVRSSIGVHARK